MATRLSDPKQAFTGVDEAVVGRKAGITKQTIQLSYGVYKTVDAKLTGSRPVERSIRLISLHSY